ncbi:MAG: glycosyltransferase, partial [Dehalococcoidia bacterium]|nr:glycosyltransferase [Dehalococcoidia bacterium]
KTHRYSVLEATGFAGMVDIIGAFDLTMTSDPTALPWYTEHGAHAIYSPPGANPDVFVPRDCERDIPVLFVGKNYGRRAQIIGQLADAGIDVTCYGQGWPRGPIDTAGMVDAMNRAQITLGIGETADPSLLSLKGRDFEAPMCGAFYLTQRNEELFRHYAVQKEIVMWGTSFMLPHIVRYWLAHPEACEVIRHAAALRARRDHTWRRRFEAAFAAMGLTWGEA